MSMTIVTAEAAYREAEGDWYLAYIVATEEPKSNVTGADVIGCSPDDRFVAGSVIDCPSGQYVAFEDGVFSAKG